MDGESESQNYRKAVVDSLIRSLKKEQPSGTVVFLSGCWGSGKTYLWRNEILPYFSSEHPVEVSLFGIESIDALKNRLMCRCMSRRFKLGRKEMRKAVSGTGKMILWGLRKGLKGIDSHLQTNLISAKTDPIELIDEGLIICLDDIERAGRDLDITEILGLVSHLSESKHSRVLLIADEEHIGKDSGDGSGSDTFTAYKERVVSEHVQLVTDVSEMMDLFISDNSVLSEKQGPARNRILEMIRETLSQGECENLRTVARVLKRVEAVLDIFGSDIPLSYLKCLTVLSVEHARGRSLEKGEFKFNPLTVALRDKFGSKGESKVSAQEKVLRTFYSEEMQNFVFSEALFQYVTRGVLDVGALKEEIQPTLQGKTRTEELLATLMTGNWDYFSDAEIGRLLDDAEECLVADVGSSAKVILRVAAYYDLVGGRIDRSMKEGTMNAIVDKLEERARSLDDSFGFEDEIFLKEIEGKWKDWLLRYREALGKARNAAKLSELFDKIAQCDFESFLDLVHRDTVGAIALLAENSLFEKIEETLHVNRPFYFRVLGFLGKELCNFTEGVIPNIGDLRRKYAEYVGQKSKDNNLGRMDRHHFARFLSYVESWKID